METAQKTIRIKWVRSGIGFDRSQSEVVRSLGLRRLNHVVERPDTPQVRGLVAKVAHLVEVVSAVPQPVWAATPEYVLEVAEGGPASPSERSFSSQKEAETVAAGLGPGSVGVSPARVGEHIPAQAGETPALPAQPTSGENLRSRNEQGDEE
jgi:large subunit ribosomal protein L30